MGADILPSPWSGQFRNQWKGAEHIVIPTRVVAPPVENLLHRIAKYDGRQNRREMADDSVLIGIAVLILVDNNQAVACEKHLVDMPTDEESHDRCLDGRVVPSSILEVEINGIYLRPRRKGLQNAKGPAIDC